MTSIKDFAQTSQTEPNMWYIAIEFEPKANRVSDTDTIVLLTDLLYMTHHWKRGIKKQDGYWTVDFETREACHRAWEYAQNDGVDRMCSIAKVSIMSPDLEVVETLALSEVEESEDDVFVEAVVFNEAEESDNDVFVDCLERQRSQSI